MVTSVLIIEHDPDVRNTIGSWLEAAGYNVTMCPGPSPPTYSCPGNEWAPCPLASNVDLVVLDMRLASDEALQGPPAWHLLAYYVGTGKKVVALVSSAQASTGSIDTTVVAVVERPPEHDDLLAALDHLAAA